jgi:hypothetical protein
MKIMIIDNHDTGTKVQREYQPIFVQHPTPSQKIMTCVGENNYFMIKKNKNNVCLQFPPNLKKNPPQVCGRSSCRISKRIRNSSKSSTKHEETQNKT